MPKKLILDLDEKVYQRLLTHCQGDENALKEYAAEILAKHSQEDEKDAESDKTKKGLEDYLKKGTSGSRSYGIKGQGW
ncbi:MAG: hypothetical protein NPINA01_29390 [Nitrospinaceae bacterium]|nr:MAG: hypothetical protein NPINA01_29390 [Nitrospinaceae bacterium]